MNVVCAIVVEERKISTSWHLQQVRLSELEHGVF